MSSFYFDSDCKKDFMGDGNNYRKIKAHDGGLMAVEIVLDKGAIGDLHAHPHEQLSYILEGIFEYTAGDETKIVKEGDSLYFGSNAPHGCKMISDKGRILDVFTPQRTDFLHNKE